MTSVLLQVSSRYIMTFQVALSIYFLLRGHSLPGGGFVGGLLVASAFALYAIAFGVEKARHFLFVEPERLMGIGLFVSLLSGLFAVFQFDSFMKAIWIGELELPGIGKVAIGTPFLFDVGVYLVVFGMTVSVIFSLFERDIEMEED